MDFVWITPKWPFPITDGARIATTQLLKSLTSQGQRIHLCAFVLESDVIDVAEVKQKLGVSRVTLIRKKSSGRFQQLRSLLMRPFFPVTFAPYSCPHIAKKFKSILRNSKADVVVYDGLHAAAWRKGGAIPFKPMGAKPYREAYRAHNVESEIWFSAAMAAKNPLKKWFLQYQGRLVKRLETEIASEVDFIFPVSLQDDWKFKTQGIDTHSLVLPIGMETSIPVSVPRFTSPHELKRNILFIGKLDWAPNREGLTWFLQNVWPGAIARAPDLFLRIVGSGVIAFFFDLINLVCYYAAKE